MMEQSTQILPETPVTQTTNTSGDRARVDTKHPEVTTVALTSSNSGANTEEFPIPDWFDKEIP